MTYESNNAFVQRNRSNNMTISITEYKRMTNGRKRKTLKGKRKQTVSCNRPLFFFRLLKEAGLPEPATEFQFHSIRKWRFDFAWVDCKIALEVEGGVWTNGRHTRGQGFLGDMEKYNHAALAGWFVLRTTPNKLHSPTTLNLIREAMELCRA